MNLTELLLELEDASIIGSGYPIPAREINELKTDIRLHIRCLKEIQWQEEKGQYDE